MHTEIKLLPSNSLMWTTTLLQQFNLFVNSFKWTLAVMLHSVNDNVNNNKAHFILVHGQINALEHIL